MNPEFQKLLDITLTDGFLNEKERNVLRKKGEAMGMSADEVDIIIDARLFEINRDKKAGEPVDKSKCPKCGEQLTGVSVVCPSCNFITNNNETEGYTTADKQNFLIDEERQHTSLQADMRKLNKVASKIKTAKAEGFGKVIKSGILIFISSGLYIIYKKFIKKETLFDRYEKATKRYVTEFSLLSYDMTKKYENSTSVLGEVKGIDTELSELSNKRNRQANITGLFTFATIGVIIFLVLRVPKPQSGPASSATTEVSRESPEEKTERHIKMGRISEAKKSMALMEDGAKRDEFFIKVRDLEIDSLAGAHDYIGALKLARTIKNNDPFENEMERKVDDIVEKQVEYLSDEHRFKEAREAMKMASYPKSSSLEVSINLDEMIYKDSKKTKR
ncbi:hypothetical protein ACLI09_08540 [Flavobacterium sp. RHBU_24]|uniref:hypothetical protein n=1 Tax=Flavobacterium sp. RHBU_24 TaxID=3391185 RepID=UPI003984BFEC